MKRTILIPALMCVLLLGTLSYAHARGKKDKPREGTLQGMIHVYGSEPHTWVGLKTVPDGKVYAIVPAEKADEYRDLQGRFMEVKVKFQDTALPPGLPPGDGIITPLSWQPAQPPQSAQ